MVFLLTSEVAKRRDGSLKCTTYWLRLSTDRHISQQSQSLTHYSVSSADYELKEAYQLRCRSQWPRGLRRRSAAARLLRWWFRIPPGAWMSVCCECRVLSGRGLCDELITRPEESYRLWCVVVCNLETSWMRRPWPTGGCSSQKKKSATLILALSWMKYSKGNFSGLWQRNKSNTQINQPTICISLSPLLPVV